MSGRLWGQQHGYRIGTHGDGAAYSPEDQEIMNLGSIGCLGIPGVLMDSVVNGFGSVLSHGTLGVSGGCVRKGGQYRKWPAVVRKGSPSNL